MNSFLLERATLRKDLDFKIRAIDTLTTFRIEASKFCETCISLQLQYIRSM